MLDKIEKLVSELENFKNDLMEILSDEDLKKYCSKEETQKRKKREYNRKFYQRNKKKHW